MSAEEQYSANDYLLPLEMRKELKEPLGQLIVENPTQNLLKEISTNKPPLTIFVGDYCTQDVLEAGYTPDISIIDGKNLRKKFAKILIPNAKVIKAKNPPAMVTSATWHLIAKQIGKKTNSSINDISKEPIVLFIDGEEDLLVFPAVIESPEGSFVIYGQPHEGVVLIKVTANIKFKFKKFIERMKVNKNED